MAEDELNYMKLMAEAGINVPKPESMTLHKYDDDDVRPEDSVSQIDTRRYQFSTDRADAVGLKVQSNSFPRKSQSSSSSLVTASSQPSKKKTSRAKELELSAELEIMKRRNQCEERKRLLQRQIEEEMEEESIRRAQQEIQIKQENVARLRRQRVLKEEQQKLQQQELEIELELKYKLARSIANIYDEGSSVDTQAAWCKKDHVASSSIVSSQQDMKADNTRKQPSSIVSSQQNMQEDYKHRSTGVSSNYSRGKEPPSESWGSHREDNAVQYSPHVGRQRAQRVDIPVQYSPYVGRQRVDVPVISHEKPPQVAASTVHEEMSNKRHEVDETYMPATGQVHVHENGVSAAEYSQYYVAIPAHEHKREPHPPQVAASTMPHEQSYNQPQKVDADNYMPAASTAHVHENTDQPTQQQQVLQSMQQQGSQPTQQQQVLQSRQQQVSQSMQQPQVLQSRQQQQALQPTQQQQVLQPMQQQQMSQLTQQQQVLQSTQPQVLQPAQQQPVPQHHVQYPQEHYSQMQNPVHYNQLQQQQDMRDLTQLLIQQQVRASLPEQRITTFDGDPLKYTTFLKAFEYGVEDKTKSFTDRLTYLCQYTSGRPISWSTAACII
jgi:hypothetical protein